MTIAVPGGKQEAFPTISEAMQRKASLPRHHGSFPRDGRRPQHDDGRRITEWDRAQARWRQAEEIKRSLFCGVADRDEELLELERAVDELELMMERVPRCWLPPLVPTNEALTGEKATTAITKHHILAHSKSNPIQPLCTLLDHVWKTFSTTPTPNQPRCDGCGLQSPGSWMRWRLAFQHDVKRYSALVILLGTSGNLSQN